VHLLLHKQLLFYYIAIHKKDVLTS